MDLKLPSLKPHEHVPAQELSQQHHEMATAQSSLSLLKSSLASMELEAQTPYRHAYDDIDRASSILQMAYEEIAKTKSLECLVHLYEKVSSCNRSSHWETMSLMNLRLRELFVQISTALVFQLDTPTPKAAIILLHDVLDLFWKETEDTGGDFDLGPSPRKMLMSDCQSMFASCLSDCGVAKSLTKLAPHAELGMMALNSMFRLLTLLGDSFGLELVKAGLGTSLMNATR
eukprot:4229408-Prymnesium_polylepis.1